MAELTDQRGTASGEDRARAPADATAGLGPEASRRSDRLGDISLSIAAAVLARELSRRAARLEEVSRSAAGAEGASGRIAGLGADIERLLEGFDDRLAAVNRRLDRVLERRA
jgi:hypothetical protein